VTASKVTVTVGPHERLGNWYIIVKHGSVVEHIRVKDAADAPAVLKRTFGIPPARAGRMLAAVAQ